MPFVCAGTASALQLLSLPSPTPASSSAVEQDPCFHLNAPWGSRRHSRPPMFASLLLTASCSTVALVPTTRTPPAAPHQEEPLLQLPFGIHQGTTLLHYVWDGHGVVALDAEQLQPLSDMSSQQQAVHRQQGGVSARLRRWLLQVQDQLSKAFLPNRKDVNDDYWEWLQWRMTSRFLTSTMQNLSTQSMLMALGLGAKKSVAASAAINWLLKDGVGRIARMTVATQFCQSFDSDLKRIRYVTSLIQSLLMSGEFITPFFPQHFLPLASVANLGKAISLAAFVAVAPSFQRALCRGNNLADLTAKNQAQHMVVDMLALGVSATAMYFARHNERARILMPLLAYPLLAVADAWATYNELKSIELKALNRERAEMVAEHWLLSGKVPSAYEISHEEHLLLPPDISGGLLPLSITSLDKLVRGPHHASSLLQLYGSEQYLMTVRMPGGTSTSSPAAVSNQQQQQQQGGLVAWIRSLPLPRLPGLTHPAPKLQMSLSESAEASDILKAVLEAAHLRLAVRGKLEAKLPEGRGQARQPAAAGASYPVHQGLIPGDQLWAAAGALLSAREMEGCVAEARRQAAAGLPRFLAALAAQGWKTRSFLLSTTEKVRYVPLARRDAKQKRQKQGSKEKERA